MVEQKKVKVLVIEDESSIRKFINISLVREGYEVCEASCGKEVMEQINYHCPDVILLDVMLPDADGFDICRNLRKRYAEMIIIMLTARSQDMDKIMGLELGADDYIVKPFNPLELSARIRSILRRSYRIQTQEIAKLISGPFLIDILAQKAYKSGEELNLTPKEFGLLKLLIKNSGRAFSRDELLNEAWGYDFVGDPKTVDVHVRRIREKIGDTSGAPVYLETIWGVGYRWREAKQLEKY
ncbi:MAG TPA: response regulator transcription factor [Clostridia bacterium]|nr:response regulator transcription factor [Clostridia bacterium]